MDDFGFDIVSKKHGTFRVLLSSQADLDLALANGPWHIRRGRHAWYAMRDARRAGRHTVEYLHRLLLGAPRGVAVDHIDGNGLNNLRDNLRLCSLSENNGNSQRRSDNTSGFKGVSWHRGRGKWQASISLAGRDKYLGLFDTQGAAHEAYKAAATKMFGEFANPDGTHKGRSK